MSTMPVVTKQYYAQPELLHVTTIIPSPTNPRKTFEKVAMDELTESVRRHGVLQPLLLRPWPEGRKRPKSDPGGFELVAGERRFRAAMAAGLEEVPALVRELTDSEVLEIQIIENLQRSDLHPLEEAEGYRQLMAAKYDVARIADRVGRSTAYVYDRVTLLALSKAGQKLFLEGSITVAHAIILARLNPADQARAIGKGEDVRSPLFTSQRVLEGASLKPITARELQAWVDKNVRFDRDNVDPMLFPETALALKPAAAAPMEKPEKIVPITPDHYIDPDAKVDGERTYGPMSWRRADGKEGSKACPFAVTGVIVVGLGRGEAFKVCIAKKSCTVHWASDVRAAKKRATGAGGSKSTANDRESAWQREEKKRQEEYARDRAEEERWKKAAPKILEAMAAAVKKAPVGATGLLAEIVVECCTEQRHGPKTTEVPRGKTAEDLVRHAAFLVIHSQVHGYQAFRDFPKHAKAFGVDVRKIVDEVAPPPAPEKPAAAAKAQGPLKRKAKR